MSIDKKNTKFKPLYKKFLNLRENVQNKQKLLKFKKKKWTTNFYIQPSF